VARAIDSTKQREQLHFMNRLPFYLQLAIFLLIFLVLAMYIVGALETEDGSALLVIVLFGGLISTFRAVYVRNKKIKGEQK
jgi:membrane protein CcdC involved in cytochrome C biogenesis